MEAQKAEERKWYVLHFIKKSGKTTPQKYIDDFNKEGYGLELYAPVIRPAQVNHGKVEYKERLLTFYYVFVRGFFEEVKELCLRPNNDLSFLLDRGSENRYATISDSDMENFMIYARAQTNALSFFNLEDIELNEGDVVEIVGGEYDGLKGTFLPKSRSSKGNLVISVTAALGAMAWNVDARHVRILEFAQDTRRQYDIVDAFIPKFLLILRKFHAGKELDAKDKSLLNVFSLRMGVVSLSNHKAEAKLLAVLMCVQFILGDVAALKNTQERFEKRKAALTNIWTIALVELMMSVTLNDCQRLREAYKRLPLPSENLTKTQREMIDEYRYYLG
ncbi:MAG: hypothetical protein K2M79_03145 [Muribaculaceae bacterium]|nr:hypothetical protein [Muribaculaceae bacterium]